MCSTVFELVTEDNTSKLAFLCSFYLIPCNYKLPFSIVSYHENLFQTVFAQNNLEQLLFYSNDMIGKYHRFFG